MPKNQVAKRKTNAAAKAAPKAGRTTPAPKAAKAAKSVPTVADFMTRSPHTIGRDQTLKQAHDLMNKYRIRHLPVLEGGELVGLVSQRDLYFVESLDGEAPARITVEEAMSQDVFEVPLTATLEQVTQSMVRKKHGCAVVLQDERVVGVFSTIDAMKALLHYLQR
jgi:acetoin utilization protein AcuB